MREKVSEADAHCLAGFADAHCLQDPCAPQLPEHVQRPEESALLQRVRLDAAHLLGRTFGEHIHQLVDLMPKVDDQTVFRDAGPSPSGSQLILGQSFEQLLYDGMLLLFSTDDVYRTLPVGVSVLDDEVASGVGHAASLVHDREAFVVHYLLLYQTRRVQLSHDLVGQQTVFALPLLRLRVEQREYAEAGRVEQVNGVLVVDLLDVFPLDPVVLLERLFVAEHVCVEVLLELLVGLVDAQLLEAVVVKHLETLYVQQRYLGLCLGFLLAAEQHVVYAVADQSEQILL